VRRIAAITLFGLLACRERIENTPGELRVSTPRVDLPHAYVGQTKFRDRLEVINASRSFRSGKIGTLAAPFSVEHAGEELTLPGAGSVKLRLSFSPLEAGRFEQTLLVEDEDGRTLPVLVTGTAEAAPQCMSASPCRASSFDLELSACVETPANEGADCTMSNACYASARCAGGNCVGTAIDCDDDDACSTDLCDSTRGCVHFPATARCPAPPDACHVSVCDPAVGCRFDDAPDGTRCGPSDCSTAHICLLGQCKAVAVSEGAPCGDDSPCQPKGRCNEGACVRPPKRTLTAAWTAWAPQGHVVEWDSVADPEGNVYYRERPPGVPMSRLTSVSPTGVKRWQTDVFLPQQVSLMNGLLIVRKPEGLEAHATADGVVQWSRDFSSAELRASVRAYSRGVGGSLYLGYWREDGGIIQGSVITSLNVFNGATLWQNWLPGQMVQDQTMPADENGYVYVGTYDQPIGKFRYLSFTPSGQQRWSMVNPHANPAAVFGGRVYHWDHWLSETSDGGWVNEEPPRLLGSGYPRLALGAISFVGVQVVDGGSCANPAQDAETAVLVRVDPSTSRAKWALSIADPVNGGGRDFTNTVLTSRSTIVFSQSIDYCSRSGQVALREISATGESSWTCPLPGPETYYGEALLSGGMYITAVRSADGGPDGVRAILLPGFELPEHGWATAWGSPARDNHAR